MAESEENKCLPPNVALDASQQKEFNQKVTELKKKGKKEGSGVIYIGHIPHGFFEPQMKEYFSQFGKVSKLRIARSKKTGNMKGYAFCQFASQTVAKIVAESMNNYLMFHRLLKCQLVPPEKLHPETFKGHNKKFKRPKAAYLSIERHNKTKDDARVKQCEKRMKRKKAKSLSKLADLGISFEYPGLVNVVGKEVTSDTGDNDMETETPLLETQTMLANEAMRVLHGHDSDGSDDESISISAVEPAEFTKPTSQSKELDELPKTVKKVAFRKSKKDMISKKLAQNPSAKVSMKVVKQPKAAKGPTKLGRRKTSRSKTKLGK